jgi:hypothetical protein
MTEKMLCTFERKILKRIYGPVQDKGCWHHSWNSEICNFYKDLNIVDNIKNRKLGWLGHIIRMEGGSIPKYVLDGKFHNTRPVGKLRTRWEGTSSRRTHHRS